MTVLGAILAGGAARRFGSDKAAALVGGMAMIERVAAALRAQTDALVVVGRDWPRLERVDDLPAPGLGPLGGLAGAVRHARMRGHAAVLTSGCDLPELPNGLRAMLEPGPAVIRGQPLLGLWPVTLADALLAHLGGSDDRSMRTWIGAAGARAVALPSPVPNINTPEELAAYVRGQKTIE